MDVLIKPTVSCSQAKNYALPLPVSNVLVIVRLSLDSSYSHNYSFPKHVSKYSEYFLYLLVKSCRVISGVNTGCARGMDPKHSTDLLMEGASQKCIEWQLWVGG